jgi:hypothetical protein
MTRLLPALVLLAGLTACARQYAPADPPPGELPERLDASVFKPEHESLRFSLNRPAYVAVFEVVPRGGVRMLYPSKSSEEVHHAGYSAEAVPEVLLSFASFFGDSAIAGFASRNEPHYFFLVASLHAMGTSRFVRAPRALFSAMGSANYAARDPHVAMRSIVTDVLRLPDDESWVSDSYEAGPEDVAAFYGMGD